jgi:hypothetical protein
LQQQQEWKENCDEKRLRCCAASALRSSAASDPSHAPAPNRFQARSVFLILFNIIIINFLAKLFAIFR